MKNEINKDYQNIYGTWQVTTEGDEEGRSVKQLGQFTGFVDEIALHLADQCFYSLNFKKITHPVTRFKPKAKRVNVSFDIESKTWDFKQEDSTWATPLFSGRPVTIEPCPYYASFTIVSDSFNEANAIMEKALAKLSDEEKRVLGLGK